MSGAPRSVLPVAAMLGEGPVWVERDGALWFVDIKAPAIHRFDPADGEHRSWPAPDQVGWVLPDADDGMLAGLKSGLHRLDPVSGTFTLLFDPEPGFPDNRLNDATTDPHGRLWFGTMDDREAAKTGRIYCAGRDGCRDSGLPSVAITNGPAISPDGMLYAVDTLGKAIWRAALYDDGTLGAADLFAEIESGAGHPDGVTCDADGHVWVGLFGGWGVRRYDPAGALAAKVAFPVANVTKVAFGGPDLRTAYATTARWMLDTAALAAQPLAGNLFTFDPDATGQRLTASIL